MGRASGAAELIDFTIERERHLRFVGREEVLARLDQWLLGPDDTRWVVVTGGPGMGKSAVLSTWLTRREAAGAQVPHHFVRRQVIDWDQPERIATSIAAQIEAIFPELRDDQARPEGRLPELIGRVSKRLGASGRLVIVIDGLDEARAEPGENPLPRFLPHVVPAGIRILCATRPTYPHLGWIEARSPARRMNLDDAQWASSNDAVVRGFWEAVAADYEPPLPAAIVAAAITRAGGNVLHAVMLHEVLRDLPPDRRRAEHIPDGLRELIGGTWDRAASTQSVRVGLGLLCAAQEALSLNMLAEVAGWSSDDKKRFLPAARQLLLEEPASWAGATAYRPRHDWVRELIAEQLVGDALAAHHAALAGKLATWPLPRDATARRYALRHALIHRVEAGAWADAWLLAGDMRFLEVKCRELGVHETEIDVEHIAERCRASGDEALVERFGDLARALARESHWLRMAPEATAALVWNRLRQLGWTAGEIGQQIQVPAGSRFLRVQHLATRQSATLVRDLVGHANQVNACAVTPDGRRVVSASEDGTLQVWDLASGRAEATLEGHADRVLACVVTPDGRRVVSASADGTLKVWDLASGRAEATLGGHVGEVRACAVTPDGRRVVSASEDGTLKVWDLASERAEKPPDGHANGVSACAVTPDGRRVVSASGDKTLKVWNLASGRAEATLEGHASWVSACAVTPDGRRVVSASSDKTLKVWDLASGRAEATLKGHASWVSACAVTPDGRRVVSASGDGTLKVWDLASGRAEAILEGHADRVLACAVTPDGRRVVSASGDKTLKVWNLASGRAEATLEGHADEVSACAVTPDGRRVVSASRDKTLKVWDLASGRADAAMEGHVDRVRACAMTPDGRWVISASSDQTLKVWDLETGACLLTHRANTSYLAVTTSATAIIAGDAAGAVWFLDLPSLERSGSAAPDHRSPDNHLASSPEPAPAAQRSQMKHTILFLAANPLGTDNLALDREARAIQVELERSGFRDRFDLVTRWAAEPLDLLRELRKLKPTVVHFSGHGTAGTAADTPGSRPHRDVEVASGHDRDPRPGLSFQGPDGQPQLVSSEALEQTFAAAGSSVQLIVLSACYSEVHAQALLPHVGCVVGMSGAIADDAARSFAIGFYGGLGERESVAAAYKQGCAAISLQGLPDPLRPKLVVRTGIDADKLILAADLQKPPINQTSIPIPAHRRQAPGAAPQVDVAILTIREDELRAALEMFPTKAGTVQGVHRQYTLRYAEAGNGERYTITVLRQVEQGLGEAQTVARDVLEDLHPRLILLVGIAGGLPSDDVTLGDVVLSTRIHDFTVEERNVDHEVRYAATGGPIDRAIANLVADLPNRDDELGAWTTDLQDRPPVAWTRTGQLYGPPDWQSDLRAKLEHHYGDGSAPRPPRYVAGPIASSDRLVKDPELLISWLATARNLLAIEMESGGVYRAVRERCPMLTIRGISDIVGLKRADAWTKYACASAAAFTRAFLRMRPVETSASTGAISVPQ